MLMAKEINYAVRQAAIKDFEEFLVKLREFHEPENLKLDYNLRSDDNPEKIRLSVEVTIPEV